MRNSWRVPARKFYLNLKFVLCIAGSDDEGAVAAVGKVVSLAFHTYVERQNRSPNAIWAMILLWTTPGAQGGLKP